MQKPASSLPFPCLRFSWYTREYTLLASVLSSFFLTVFALLPGFLPGFPLAFALAFPLVVAPLRPEVTLGGRPRRGADAPEAAAGAVLGPRLGRGTTLLFSMGSSEGFAACAVASGSCQIICSGCDVSPKSYRVENSLD